jgi:predicted house-cleaning noncanonical NTP pyrophosphatase (MazG superfamily)
MENMKKIIKETIVEMIKNDELQFEVKIIDGNYYKQVETTVYYSDDMPYKEEIQRFSERIDV